MAQIEVKVGMYSYQMACGDGQENNLLEMANRFNKRLSDLASRMQRGVDIKTIVTACIMMENEIDELKSKSILEKSTAKESLNYNKDNKNIDLFTLLELEAIAKQLENG